MISESMQGPQHGQMAQSKSCQAGVALGQADTAACLREVKRLEGDWEKCQQGLARLDEYRDFMLQNAEKLRRWRNSFSDPIEKMPGGREFAEEQEAEIRKSLAQSDEVYEDVKAKYLAKQKEIEDQIDAAKKRMVANDAVGTAARRSNAESFAAGAGVTLASGSSVCSAAYTNAYGNSSATNPPEHDRSEAR